MNIIRSIFRDIIEAFFDALPFSLGLIATLFLCLAALLCSGEASAACGFVNGNYVCDEKAGCGLVNGQQECALPPGCGYVNGEFRCNVSDAKPEGTPAAPGIYNPKAGDASKPNAGLVAGLEWLSNFFAGKGSDDWLASALAWFAEKLVSLWLDTKLWFMKIGWSVAKSILTDLGVFAAIASAVTGLPAEIRGALNFFKVFEAVSMILTAGMTKFVLRFIPGA